MLWTNELGQMGMRAKNAARKLATIESNLKNEALASMSEALLKNRGDIERANHLDLDAGKEIGLSAALIDRLTLTPSRIEAMATGLKEIAAFHDPVGEVTRMWNAEQGLRIGEVRVPLGVVGIIYEARPNVTADAAGLCLKSGNAVILRGGKEAFHSNKIIADVLIEAATQAGIPDGAIQLLASKEREATIALMQLPELDVLIPRGGAALKKSVQENARVPYIMTGMGNCHCFIDASADLEKAEAIVLNAKCQRSGVCNAIETLLIHKDVCEAFAPRVLKALHAHGVELRCDDATRAFFPEAIAACEDDWSTEFHDLILAVKVVSSLEEAMDHIHRYSTQHSEAIVTENYSNAQRFLAGIDSAAVYVNASTRFTDGSVFGFGAEMGISTQKLHARGPMGVQQLTSSKFIIYGSGQTRK